MIQSISGMGGGMMAMQGARGGGGPEKAFSTMDADGDGDGALTFAEFESGHSMGMLQGGAAGMMAAKMGFAKNQMDLSSLFNSSDEESEKEEESIYAYA